MAARRTGRVAPRPRPRPSSSPMVSWRATPHRIARPGSFFGGGRCEPQLLGQAWCALARVEPPPPPQFERRWESDPARRAADSDAAENHSEAEAAWRWRKRVLSGLLTAGQHPYPREVVPRPCRVLGQMAVLAHNGGACAQAARMVHELDPGQCRSLAWRTGRLGRSAHICFRILATAR